MLKECFNHFRGGECSFNDFICGADYHKVNAEKWQLLNFLRGEAKNVHSIYITRRTKLRGKESVLGRVLH